MYQKNVKELDNILLCKIYNHTKIIENLIQFMNTLSVVIQNNMTVEELAVTDFFFQPHFNKPWSLLNSVALKALK